MQNQNMLIIIIAIFFSLLLGFDSMVLKFAKNYLK